MDIETEKVIELVFPEGIPGIIQTLDFRFEVKKNIFCHINNFKSSDV